jgi:hypothetical protein
MRLACDLPDSKIGLFPQGHFMRISSHVLPGPSQKNPLIVVGVIGLIVLLAYELAQYVIAGDFVGLSYIGLSVMVGAAMLTMLNNWRAGTFIFFAWLFFEDFARKYLGNNMAIYFGKDVLVAVIYLSYFIAYRRKQVRTFRPPFLIPLLLFVWFGVIQVFNPASTSFFFGILGLKLYFYYIPLLFIGYSIIQTEEDLRRFYPFLMLLTVIVAGLGIAQAILGHTFLNPAVMQEEIRELSANYRTAPISGVIVYRPTSVFVSAGRFAFFLVPAFLFAFGYGAYLLLRSKDRRLFTLLTLAVTTSAIALCASRGTLLWTAGSIIVCVPAFLWGCPWQKGQLLRVFRGFQRAALAGVAALLLTLVFYPDALGNPRPFEHKQRTLAPYPDLSIATAWLCVRLSSLALRLRYRHGFAWHPVHQPHFAYSACGNRCGERIWSTGPGAWNRGAASLPHLGRRHRRLRLVRRGETQGNSVVSDRICHFLVCLFVFVPVCVGRIPVF